MLEALESRCLLAGGGPQGVASGSGTDSNLWLTLGTNSIGMIDPNKIGAGVTQYPIPTAGAGAGPIAAGPEPILYASDLNKAQIYKVDKTTGALLETIPVSEPVDSLIFDSHNHILYSAFDANGVGQVRMVDPTIGISSDTLLATVGNRAVDLALVPGGDSVLVTSQSTGKIYEVSLTNPGQAPTTFGSGQYAGGIVYDQAGRLYAVSGSKIVELDPATFQVIASSGALAGLDGLAFDPSTGDLFAGSRSINPDSGREGFYELSLQPDSFLQAKLITSPSFPTTFDPDGLETDGEGNLYLASEQARGDNKIYRYNLFTDQLTALTSPLPGLDDLVPLSGGGGHSAPGYWFYEESAGRFGVINPTTGHITEVPLATSGNPQVAAIAPGPGGTMWFTEPDADRIGVIDTDTDAITEFAVPTAGARPSGIVEGTDGSMWFTEAGANQIGKINPTTHVIQEFRIDPSGNDDAEGITLGPDSNLWFTLNGTNRIGEMNPATGAMVAEFAVPTPDAGLSQIVSDPKYGGVWFTEQAADRVANIILTTGAVTEFKIPSAGAAPGAIAVDRSGNVWIAESNANRIAELSPTNPNFITEYSVPGTAGGGSPSPTPTPTPNPGPSPTPTPTPTSRPTPPTPPSSHTPRTGSGGPAGPARIVLTAKPRPAPPGRPVTLTATVKERGRGKGGPTGSIEFLEGPASLGNVALRRGRARLKVTGLHLGLNTIEAEYIPGPGFAAGAAVISVDVRAHHSRSRAAIPGEMSRPAIAPAPIAIDRTLAPILRPAPRDPRRASS